MSLSSTSTHLLNTSRGGDSTTYPGQPVPAPDNPFSDEIFSNIQSEPPLVQLEGTRLLLGKRDRSPLTTTAFHVVVERDKVSRQPPFLQTKQFQFPQPLLIRLVLWTLHQPHCSSLDALQHLSVRVEPVPS